jgi:hypothetical protein
MDAIEYGELKRKTAWICHAYMYPFMEFIDIRKKSTERDFWYDGIGGFYSMKKLN